MMSASRLAREPAGYPVLADDVLEFHAARLLLLLKHSGIGNKIDGLTKLAKLDFFVRYPQFFEAVCRKIGKPVQAPKRDVESSMVRFHYGPWDKRYYHLLSYLEAKGLLAVESDGNKFVFRLTPGGKQVADSLDQSGNFTDLTAQMKAVKEVFGKRSGSTLRDLIYQTFEEEVASRPLDEVID